MTKRFLIRIADPNAPDLDAEIEAREAREELARIVEAANLTEREHRVITLRTRDSRTLTEIGDELGVSRERVRQIEAEALRKLRAAAGSLARGGIGRDV